jgi:plastocyanin
MSRRLIPAFFLIAVLSVAACTSGTPTGSVSVSPSAPAVSAPAVSAPAAGACAPSTDTGTIQATMAQRAFTPATINAKVGDVIAWTNNDRLSHTATVDADPACTTETLANGATGAVKFTAAGTYPFHCQIHPDMTGTIEVTG